MAKFERMNKKEFNPITDNLIYQVRNDSPISNVLDNNEATTDLKSDVYAPINSRLPREKLTKQMRYQVTPSEETEIKLYMKRVSEESGSSPTHSNMMRAYFLLLLRAESRIIEELRRSSLQRPINDQFAITQFEEELSEIILTAIRQTPLRVNNFE